MTSMCYYVSSFSLFMPLYYCTYVNGADALKVGLQVGSSMYENELQGEKQHNLINILLYSVLVQLYMTWITENGLTVCK